MTELISRHYNNSLAGYFGIKKIQKLVIRKYNWPTLRHDIKDYMKECNIYLASKVVYHKLYRNVQFLPVPTSRWKDLSMDFVIGLQISTDWKGDSYNSILVIVNWFIKIIYYKPVKVTINAPCLAEIIIDMVVRHHSLSDSIVTDQELLFI